MTWSLLQHHRCLEHLGSQGTTVEMSTQVFACSECPFFHMQESYLLQHIEHSHPEHHKKSQRAAETAEAPKKKVQCPSSQSLSPSTTGLTLTRARNVVKPSHVPQT
ncbi:uncharacterized protein LOC108889185 [Lates calcarifer]|uniref:Uncharacterized protein LOC108889185 n=1 Tax=Lates calcarifer TaxID=8187 RepID=A0AAJ7PXA1_LATCA|nr:uncharacterized protein LOC108889185 [Lates calcarifer]